MVGLLQMKRQNESIKELAKGVLYVALIGGVLILLMSWFVGRSPMDGAEREVYKVVKGKELALWIYKPKDWKVGDRRPSVIWFFGGGWKVGSPVQFAAQSRHLAKKGLVSIVADYRVKSRHGSTPFESVMDARSAMRWLKEHATDIGIDPDGIVAAGGSSGGQLALACELFDDVNEVSDSASVRANPVALILFNPAVNLDIPLIRNQTDEGELKRLRTISPHHRLSEALPPTLIFHGSADAIIPEQSVAAFVAKSRELGSERVLYHKYAGRTHEFYFGSGSRKDYKDTLSKIEDFLQSLNKL